jgi:hypothetical protein
MGSDHSATGRFYVRLADPKTPDPRGEEPDEAPETPLDEPRPPRIQDPPPQPDQKGPYTVHAHDW